MKRNNIKLLSQVLISAFVLSSCSDSFLEDKKNYDNVNAGIYDYYSGANARVSDVYAWSLPDPNSDANWKYNCTGNADDQSKSTEEY
ncbi:MAG: RagB/SusD family nutrient uptake outer membrane protein, partial [Prevotella sp.]|nr:RagB/SusD family nutrient uptake outer membrane protein [Prevotella sp.]